MAMSRIGITAILDFVADKALVTIKNAGTQVGRLQDSFRQASHAAFVAQMGLTNIAMALTPIAAAGGAALGFAAKRALNFEEELGRLSTVLPGGVTEAKGFQGAIEKLSTTFGKSSEDVARGFTLAIGSAIPAGEATSFLEVAGKAAAAGFADLGTSVDALTDIVNAYRGQLDPTLTLSENAMKIADQMFIANEKGKITFDDLATSVGRVAGSAAIARVPFNEVASALAAITITGINTSEAVTSVNQILNSFLGPTEEAKEMAEALGFELSAKTLEERGLLGAMKLVRERAGTNAEALNALFGNIRAFRGVAILAGSGTEYMSGTLQEMGDRAGVTDQKFQDLSNTISFQFSRAVQAASLSIRRFGLAIIEGIGEENVRHATDFLISRFDAIEITARKLVIAVKLAADRFGLFDKAKLAVGELTKLWERFDAFISTEEGAAFIGKIIIGLIALTGALAGTAAILLPVVTVFSGFASILSAAWAPIGLLGGGIASLAGKIKGLGISAGWLTLAVEGFFFALIRNFGGLQGAFAHLGRGLWVALTVVIGIFKDLFAIAWPIIVGLAGVLSSILGPAMHAIGTILEKVMPIVGKFLHAYLGVFAIIAEALGFALLQLADFITMVAKVIVKWARPTFKQWGEQLREFYDKYLQPVFELLEKGLVLMRKFRKEQEEDIIPRTKKAEEALAAGKKIEVEATGGATAAGLAGVPLVLENNLNLDGRNINLATSRAQLELTERAGSKVTPWQRRLVLERGAMFPAPA